MVDKWFDDYRAKGCDFDLERPDFRPTRGVPSTPPDGQVPMSELDTRDPGDAGGAFEVADAPEIAPVEFDGTELV